MRFTFDFSKKKILAICEAILAIGTFFLYFVPQITYVTITGDKTHFNGFQAYLGGSEKFATSFGGVFYIILLIAFIALCVAKVFVHPNNYKALNITAIVVVVLAVALISCAGTKLMLSTSLRFSGSNGSGIHYYVGSFIQIGVTACLGAFIAVDQWAL